MKHMVAAFALLLTIATSTGQASASPDKDRGDHCVLHVVGERATGELVVSEPACYETFERAMALEGVGAWGAGASVQAVAAGSFTIGIHYDGANFTGASTSVVGSSCAGGWLNVSAVWNNRISSTEHGCPRIRHFSGTNLTGSSQTTYSPGGNLATLNNQTSSIQYLT